MNLNQEKLDHLHPRPYSSRVFSFWGYIKQVVYMVKINDLNLLNQRIRDAAESVIPDVLTSV
jgi:hypothetical protein